jgi:hypothetical protein
MRQFLKGTKGNCEIVISQFNFVISCARITEREFKYSVTHTLFKFEASKEQNVFLTLAATHYDRSLSSTTCINIS